VIYRNSWSKEAEEIVREMLGRTLPGIRVSGRGRYSAFCLVTALPAASSESFDLPRLHEAIRKYVCCLAGRVKRMYGITQLAGQCSTASRRSEVRRKTEVEGGPALGVGSRPEVATVGLDNRAADRESYSRALGFRGEECVKDLTHLVARQPDASVADRDQYRTARIELGLDRKRSWRVCILDGINGVERKIHKDLGSHDHPRTLEWRSRDSQ